MQLYFSTRQTPYTLIKDTINIFFQKKINDRIIAEFIEQNNAMFRLHGTDDENLSSMISLYNNDYEIQKIKEELENEQRTEVKNN